MDRIRIAHISDLHFSNICLSPLQFFSKRWLGNLHLLLKRKRIFRNQPLQDLAGLFHKNHVDLVLITGDLSTTGRKKEFKQARAFCQQFEKLGQKVLALPGNHDHYTKQGWKKKHFYEFFQEQRLKTEGLTVHHLNSSWTLVALDTALATSLNSSRGLFSEELEEQLSSVLSSIPPHRQILLANHFPLFGHEKPSKIMERSTCLRELLKRFPNVRLYLHGHTHAHCIADLRVNGLPIIVDSGSTAHLARGTWNLLELHPHSVRIQAFKNISQPLSEHGWSFSNG